MLNIPISGLILTIFGFLLVIAMVVVIFYYYSSKRKKHIEAPKYDMLKDDDHDVS